VHELIPQTPPTQFGVAPPGDGHCTPQALQWFTLVLVLVSQPLLIKPSQLPKPALQVMLQVPAEQAAVPLLLLQALPQPPQLAVLFRFTSQPLAGLLSQSA
jgi:hypothetical protein